MKKALSRLIIALSCMLLVVLAIYGGILAYRSWQKTQLSTLDSAIQSLEAERVPLRFTVLSRDNGTLAYRLRLYDLSGAEYASKEGSIQGESLFFDFLSVSRGASWLAFPYRVFSDQVAAMDGLSLVSLVQPEDKPRAYQGAQLSEKDLLELGKLYTSMTQGQTVPRSFGNAVHDVPQLGRFETGLVYKIVVRTKGGIEIMEDE